MGALGLGLGPVFRRHKAGFSDEYQAVYDSFTTKPSAAVGAEQDVMVQGWVSSGIWAKRDVVYVLAGHTNDNGESLINWKSPGTNDATAVNAPAFVAFEGFTGNGTTSYIDTNYNPTTDGENYTQDSVSMGIYSRSDLTINKIDIGVSAGVSSYMYTRYSNSKHYGRINGGAETNDSISSSLGTVISSRTASNVYKVYHNKLNIVTSGAISSGVPTGNFLILAQTGPASLSTRQLSLGFLGGGYTQQNIDDETDLFEVYMDSNGKGVIA